MELYRILLRGKSSEDSSFFTMDIWPSIELAQSAIDRHEIYKDRDPKIVRILCEVL